MRKLLSRMHLGSGRTDKPPAPPALLKPYYMENRSLWWRLLRPTAMVAMFFAMLVYGFYYALTTPWMLVPFILPLGLMLLIIVWALPEMQTAPTHVMERCFFAFFVCLAWPNYLAIGLPGLPWITLVRLTGFPMVLYLLICISVSRTFRGDIHAIVQSTPLLWKAIIAFSVLMTLSVALSQEPMASLQKLIVGQVNWIAVFFVSVYVFNKPGRALRWANALWVIVLAVAAIALWEDQIQRVVWSGHIPSFLKIGDPIVQKLLSGAYRSATGEYRVKAVFSVPLGLAEFIALTLPFILHAILGPYPTRIRLIAIPTFFIVFLANLTTGSRLGMVGSLIGILLYTLIWAYLRWRHSKLGIIGPSLLLAYPAFAGLVLAASFVVPKLRRMMWGGGATQASDATRASQIASGIPKILENPFGYGIGRGAATVGTRGGGGVLTIDNYYLAVAVEYGVVGFVIYYGMIFAAIIYSLRVLMRQQPSKEISLLAPLAVSLASFIVIKWVYSQQDNHPLVFMMLGMVAALTYRASKVSEKAGPLSQKAIKERAA